MTVSENLFRQWGVCFETGFGNAAVVVKNSQFGDCSMKVSEKAAVSENTKSSGDCILRLFPISNGPSVFFTNEMPRQ